MIGPTIYTLFTFEVWMIDCYFGNCRNRSKFYNNQKLMMLNAKANMTASLFISFQYNEESEANDAKC